MAWREEKPHSSLSSVSPRSGCWLSRATARLAPISTRLPSSMVRRASALMAAELAKRDRSRVESRIGRALRTSELYVAHFLGTASAGRFFTLSSDKPDEVAQKVFRNAARANRIIQALTKQTAMVAGTAADALALARRHSPSAIVLDIGLPSLDGFSVLEQLRELPWKEANNQTWGGWSPLRGNLVPGTLVLTGRKPRT